MARTFSQQVNALLLARTSPYLSGRACFGVAFNFELVGTLFARLTLEMQKWRAAEYLRARKFKSDYQQLRR
jgi:hypothetical protein